MSAAPVVLHYSRKPVPHQTVPPVADGDRTAILHNVTGVTRPVGQLWERAAEATLPRFVVIRDRDGLPSILDRQENREAPFFTVAIAQSTADDLEAGTTHVETYAWRAAEAVAS